MNRRQFATAIAAAAGTAAIAPDVSGHNRGSVSPVPFKLSVMLWTVFPKLPFEQRLEKAAEAGYQAVELVDEYKNWPPEEFQRVGRKRRSLGIVFDTIANVQHGVANPGDRDAFLSEVTQLIEIGHKLECPAIIVLSGNRVPGLSRQQQHDSCVEGLKRAADAAAKNGMTLLLENIDPEENPEYYLTSVAEGFEITRKVDNPHVRFLYDFYHEQIAEGNLIKKLENNIDQVGAVHIADVPGRHAPGTGEINYRNIFRRLAELNYNRYVAMEFLAGNDAVGELRAARKFAIASGSEGSRTGSFQ
jgi:hydroxypyruvate isomerase